MSKIDTLVVNFAAYEDATEFLGMTEATLPDVEYMSETISGSGIAGEIDEIIAGHTAAMTTTLNFRTYTKATVKLLEPRIHNIELRVAQQQTDSGTGDVGIIPVRHVLKVKPKKTAMGKVSAASEADVNGDYSTTYLATYINNEKVTEIDPLNYKCLINGKDYLADVRKALGK